MLYKFGDSEFWNYAIYYFMSKINVRHVYLPFKLILQFKVLMDDMGKTSTKSKNNKPSDVADVVDTTNSNKEVFRFIDGRRYHNVENSNYSLPNDDDECDRLHLQHLVLRYAFQGNFASPVEHILNRKGTKVLDSGYVSLRM